MGKTRGAILGLATSAAITAGAFAGEIYENNLEYDAVRECTIQFEGAERSECIEGAKNAYSAGGDLEWAQLLGVVGMVGFGYLCYKGVKEEIGTTGVIEDFLP